MSEPVPGSVVGDVHSTLGRPLFNPVLKVWVGEGKLDYEVYLKTSDLLRLQTPRSELVSPDELMFQVVHQVQELWLKLLAHELAEMVGDLDGDGMWEVSARLDRAGRIIRCLADELRVLETLTPDTYQVIRRHLGNGSGQESPGYNAVRVAASYVAEALDRLLARRGVTLAEIYVPGGSPELKRVCELLVDLDEGYQTWLFAHYMLVRRTIGVGRDVEALDGVPTQVLVGRMTQPLFRSLWAVRNQLTVGWRGEGGFAPGTDRGDVRVSA
ncbi:tryptophan 2,3-dioxygenase family protein [Micromonospora purpureochromogenes]|uniref:Tryptophan 2,3-dioxygenase n=1 Tax=Micromonospora purpureochromogenes TaxID=47872 RepID=A0ABX2RTV7_9ACTN|nr:tryptophan 2,3-dioxygenase family protein [Micromonospora purpureochromogenes]NYF59781.1 tryptophan 2,3-dioxygenase [Micromonospora purpureochromogenes]